MSFRIKLVERTKIGDNLLILSDINNLEWALDHLNDAEIAYLKYAATNEVKHVFFPRENHSLIVHFLSTTKDVYYDKELYRIAGNDIVSTLSHYKIRTISIIDKSSAEHTLAYVEGAILGSYRFTKYFSEKEKKKELVQQIKVSKSHFAKKDLMDLKAILEATYIARDLVNEPQSYLTSVKLSEEVEQLGKRYGFKVEVLDKEQIEALKMGGLLAVNKGSFSPPRFCVLEWKSPKAKNKKPVVLVGKGVVFDTGGINLKPTPTSLDTMKCDMAGAATVIGTIAAVAKAKLPIHLIALIPATDNRVGNEAYLPGDVITMFDGTTVEVLNTDAEGRLILADALHYAKQYEPELVLDFATLTGAAVRSLGQHAICYMGNADKQIKATIEESGNAVFERLVEFPLWKEYGRQLKSNIADLKNIGGPTAGMITAGKFLEHFTSYPWLHFDIAGPAYLRAADAYRTKDGTGVGVRLLFDFLKKYVRG